MGGGAYQDKYHYGMKGYNRLSIVQAGQVPVSILLIQVCLFYVNARFDNTNISWNKEYK